MRPELPSPAPGMVVLRGPTGEMSHLSHGDIVGRLWSAGMVITDGRVSEAHAAITVRGERVVLMGLRGRFKVDGRVTRSVVLRAGQRILLAPGVPIDVVSVTPVREILRIVSRDTGVHTVRSVASILLSGAVETGWVDSAACCVWATGEGWLRSTPEGAVPVVSGQTWHVGQSAYVARIGPPDDIQTHGVHVRPVARIELSAGRVTISAGGDVVRLRGRSARIVRELAVVALPVDWFSLASALWEDVTRQAVRSRWDMQMLRMRDKLRQAGGRDDLVRADGTGLVELVLADGDVVSGLEDDGV